MDTSIAKRVGLWLLAPVFLIIFFSVHSCYVRWEEAERISDIYRAEGIYPLEGSSYPSISGSDLTFYADYILCEPAEDELQLLMQVDELMDARGVIAGIRSEYEYSFAGYLKKMYISFLRPSRKLPYLGYQPDYDDNWNTRGDLDIIRDCRTLLTVTFPWFSNNKKDYEYCIYRYMKNGDDYKRIYYRRKMDADGNVTFYLA